MKIKRTLCMLLAMMMVFSIAFPTSIFAEDLFFEDEFIVEDSWNEDVMIEDEELLYEEPYIEEYFEEEPADVYTEDWFVEDEAAIDEDVTLVDEVIDEPVDAVAPSEDENTVGELVLTDSETFDTGALTIKTDLADVVVEDGAKAHFTFEVEGGVGTVTYKWYYKNLNGGTSFKASSETSNTYSITANAKTHVKGFQVYCVATDGTTTLTSKTATMRVGTPGDPLKIKTDLADVTVEDGAKAQFTFEVEGGIGSVTYKWYFKNLNGGTSFKASSEKTNTYSITASATTHVKGFQVYCVATDGVTTLTSKTATMTVASKDFQVGDFIFTKLDDSTVALKKYNGSSASVVVDQIVDGKYTVVEIGESAFEGNTTLQSIDLPDTVVAIRKAAFKDCTNLSEMK